MPRASRRKKEMVLGDSWVVEGEEDGRHSTEDSEHEEESGAAPARVDGRRQTARNKSRSPDPEFIMPSLGGTNMDGSWLASRQGGRASRHPERGDYDYDVSEPVKRRNPKVMAASPRSTRPQRSSQRHVKKASEAVGGESSINHFTQASLDILGSIVGWVFDVLGMGFGKSKSGLSYVLAILIPIGVVWLLTTLFFNSIYSALSPICLLPGSSLLNLPFCPPPGSASHASRPSPPVEFEQLMVVQSKFEDVLENSAGSVSLPLDMKRGEASIRDLRQLVRYSSLHSKNELVLEFDGFIDTARIASYDLQRFNSHIGRAVDSVLATTRWTTRVLDGMAIQEGSKGLVHSIGSKIFYPFMPVRFNEDALLDQYIQHTRIVEEEIHKLIAEAQALLLVLNNLEDRLDVVHGIVTRDDQHAKKTKEEILSHLWTYVGGNRSKLTKMDRQLKLLEQVGVYRKSAYAHISGTILRLQEMGAGLEDLRERVASPELLRDRSDIPLSVHIENIQRGVERLESGRSNAKQLENERLRKTLQRDESDQNLIDA